MSGTDESYEQSIESIVENLTKFSFDDRKEKMDALVDQMRLLQQQMLSLSEQVKVLDNTPKVEVYQEVKANVNEAKEISLDMFKTLSEFNGDRDRYTAWRNTTINVMKIFEGYTDTPRYFEALSIMRNKIVGAASETLTNYNTVFNFDAIIARLDSTYADKRPIYIIEQEMTVLQQKNLSIEDYYDLVNKKLNSLINKINMTHKDKPVARAMVHDASEKALRTFVTGLRGDLGRILYASNPSTLPEAYAKIQTIVNDQERIRFANQYNQTRFEKYEPMRINPSFKPKPKLPFQMQHQNAQNNNNPKPVPMDIDKSSMNVNVGNTKRPWSGHHSNSHNNRKFQRVNQVEMVDDNGQDGTVNEEAEVNEDNNEWTNATDGDSADETSSIFLDN